MACETTTRAGREEVSDLVHGLGFLSAEPPGSRKEFSGHLYPAVSAGRRFEPRCRATISETESRDRLSRLRFGRRGERRLFMDNE